MNFINSNRRNNNTSEDEMNEQVQYTTMPTEYLLRQLPSASNHDDQELMKRDLSNSKTYHQEESEGDEWQELMALRMRPTTMTTIERKHISCRCCYQESRMPRRSTAARARKSTNSMNQLMCRDVDGGDVTAEEAHYLCRRCVTRYVHRWLYNGASYDIDYCHETSSGSPNDSSDECSSSVSSFEGEGDDNNNNNSSSLGNNGSNHSFNSYGSDNTPVPYGLKVPCFACVHDLKDGPCKSHLVIKNWNLILSIQEQEKVIEKIRQSHQNQQLNNRQSIQQNQGQQQQEQPQRRLNRSLRESGPLIRTSQAARNRSSNISKQQKFQEYLQRIEEDNHRSSSGEFSLNDSSHHTSNLSFNNSSHHSRHTNGGSTATPSIVSATNVTVRPTVRPIDVVTTTTTNTAPRLANSNIIDHNNEQHITTTIEEDLQRQQLRRHASLQRSRVAVKEIKNSTTSKRSCPTCHKSFTKDGDCNKVSCPFCQTNMCYCCRKIVPYHGYEHWSEDSNGNNKMDNRCPLYSTKKVDHNAHGEMVKKSIFQMALQLREYSN